MNPKDYQGTEMERGWFSDSVMLMDCEKAAQLHRPSRRNSQIRLGL